MISSFRCCYKYYIVFIYVSFSILYHEFNHQSSHFYAFLSSTLGMQWRAVLVYGKWSRKFECTMYDWPAHLSQTDDMTLCSNAWWSDRSCKVWKVMTATESDFMANAHANQPCGLQWWDAAACFVACHLWNARLRFSVMQVCSSSCHSGTHRTNPCHLHFCGRNVYNVVYSYSMVYVAPQRYKSHSSFCHRRNRRPQK
jgi:hypothetical protein